MKVVTLNTYLGHPFTFGGGILAEAGDHLTERLVEVRAERICGELVHTHDPDIIALQEVFSADALHVFEKVLKGYDMYASVVPNWRGVLVFSSVFASIAALVGIIAWTLDVPLWITSLPLLATLIAALYLAYFTALGDFVVGGTRGGLAVFVKRGGEVEVVKDCGICEFSEQGGDVLNILRYRCFQQLLLLVGGDEVLFTNLHASFGAPKFNFTQLVEVGRVAAKQVEEKGLRGVMVGDFNTWFDSAPIRALLEGGWEDAGVVAGRKRSALDLMTWENRNPLTQGTSKEPDNQLDWILLLGKWKVAKCEVILQHPPFLSDHYGLLADLE